MTQSSSGLLSDPDGSRVELPVFLNPPELIFTPTKRRSSLTVFNPYQNEVQFRILTTSPERYDVGVTKGTIKSGRRIDIAIRLLSNAIPDLPDPGETSQTIDYFRISVQFGQLRGNRSVEVHWCLNTEQTEESISANDDEIASRFRTKSSKSIPSTQSSRSSPTIAPLASHNPRLSNTRPSSIRPARQPNQSDGGSNVNLVCTLCTVICVITLFLPLSIDTDLCKRAKLESQESPPIGIIAHLSRLFSVSYEAKLGCSFALGLFTYRLISTLPD